MNDVIGKATLTITVQNQTIPLNSTVPAGTVLYSGWAGGENETIPGVITTQPTISSTIPVNTTMNVAGTIVGNYSSSGAVAPNYNISYIFGPGHGDLIVSSSGVVNVIVNSGAIPSRPYGAANPNLNLSSSYYTIDCTPSCGSNPIQSGTPFLSTLADVHTNVGTAQIDIAIGSLQLGVGFTDYAFNFVPGTLSITKATPTIVVTPYNTTYNGLAHTATITSITGANGETNATVGTVTLNTTHTNANTYVADSWSFTGTGNYSDISSTTITDIIGKATPTVTVTPYNTTYDGSTHTATVTSITGVNGETNATVGTVALNTTHTNANNYAGDTWSFTGTGNYNDISPTTITDIIGKATPTVVVTPYNITYDGLSHSATYTITGVNGETNGTVGTIDVSGTTHTNANTYAADSWSFMGSGNYNNISPTSITDIIGKATPTVVVTPYNITYDGLSHSATYTITGVNGETNGTVGTIDVSGTTHTNANTYNSDAWTLTGTSNYNNIGNTTITDTINQKTVTLSATKPYDGNTSLTGDVVVGTAGATGIGSETLGVVDTSAVAFSKDAGPGNYITGGVTLADGTNGGLAANYALPDLTSANANNSVTITGGSPPPPPPHPTPTPTPVPTPTPTPTPVPTPTPTPTPVVVPVPTIPSTVVRVSVNPELNFTSSNDFGGVAVDVIKQTSDIFKQFGAQNDNGRFVFDNYAPISDVLFLTPANMGLMDTSIHGSANPSTAAPANENTSNHSNDNAKEKAANDNKQGNTKSQATQRQQLLTVDPFLAQEFEIDQRKFQF